MTQRAALIERLTPAWRYQADQGAGLCPMRGQFLFAATDTNAGYFLITDERGRLSELTVDVLGQLVQEAKLFGVKLKNMRIFGLRNQIMRMPAGGRFYPLEHLQVAS